MMPRIKTMATPAGNLSGSAHCENSKSSRELKVESQIALPGGLSRWEMELLLPTVSKLLHLAIQGENQDE